MPTKMLNRLTISGALAFAATGALELFHHQQDSFKGAVDYGIEAALATGLLLTLAGLYSLHLRQKRDLGELGVWSLRVAAAGQGSLALVALATLVRGQDALGPLFAPSVLVWVIGTLAYAAIAIRKHALPAVIPATLAVGTVVGIAINPGGALVIAAAWLTISSIVSRGSVATRPAVA
jgi:hypothetical protein